MTPQPATQWIATAEKLPTDRQLVYFCLEHTNAVNMGYYKELRFSTLQNGFFGYNMVSHWMPRELPAPPPRELSAFETWHEDQPISDNPKTVAQCAWNCSATRERARFSEGVEKLATRYDVSAANTIFADLRALAAGKDL